MPNRQHIRLACGFVALFAAGCVPAEVPNIKHSPTISVVPMSDGRQCTALDRGGDDVDLICDFAPVDVSVMERDL